MAEQIFASVQCIDDGDKGTVDRRRAGAAVGVKDIAIDPEGTLAELVQIDHGPQAAADETLDLDAAAIDLAAAIARLAGVGAAGQHAVLGVSQPLPLPTRNGGTLSSTQQVQRTVVRPM